jgi:tolkin
MSDDSLKKHGVFCGSKLPNSITSEGSILRLEFKSDKTIQKTGFAGKFYIYPDSNKKRNTLFFFVKNIDHDAVK